jgi:hypothetical protein
MRSGDCVPSTCWPAPSPAPCPACVWSRKSWEGCCFYSDLPSRLPRLPEDRSKGTPALACQSSSWLSLVPPSPAIFIQPQQYSPIPVPASSIVIGWSTLVHRGMCPTPTDGRIVDAIILLYAAIAHAAWVGGVHGSESQRRKYWQNHVETVWKCLRNRVETGGLTSYSGPCYDTRTSGYSLGRAGARCGNRTRCSLPQVGYDF